MQSELHQFEHRAMATQFVLMVVGAEYSIAQSAAHAAFGKVDRLEQLLSRFLDASEVALIANLKAGETFKVAPELMELLLLSTEICAATAGAFDVTLGALMDQLSAVRFRWQALLPEERREALAACGMQRLVIDTHNLLIAVKPDQLGGNRPLELDFGAIGKGYALDQAARLLREDWELEHFLMHSGTSTVIARGSMGDGPEGWPISVGGEWITRAGLQDTRLLNSALSGSGDEVKGAHVIDARRGVAAARHAATWACAPRAALADALSTAFLAMGWREIHQLCAGWPECGALVTRKQPLWLDKIRHPVRYCGFFNRLLKP